MRFGLCWQFFWIVLAIGCRWTTMGDESPIEILETINNGNMNPDSLEIFTTEKSEHFDGTSEENTRVTTEGLIETTQNADNINNFTQENSTDISSTNSSLFLDPEPTKLEEVTDKTPKNLIVNGLALLDYNFDSDEMFNQISDLTAMELESQDQTVTEINIKESIDGRTVQRKPTEEELKNIQHNVESNEVIEDLDEILKSDAGLVEDDLFETLDEDDEVDTMFKRSKEPSGDFRNFFHSERRNFSNTNEVNITINETEGDLFDDDLTTNKYDYIEKLLNNVDETSTAVPTTPTTGTTISAQDTTVLSNAENNTVESEMPKATVLPETEAQPIESSSHLADDMEILNINVQNTENVTVESELTKMETLTEPAEILPESIVTSDIQNAKTSTENDMVESVIATTVLPVVADVEISTVDTEKLTESAQPVAILSNSIVVENTKTTTENDTVDLVTATEATTTLTETEESVEYAEISTKNYTGNSAIDVESAKAETSNLFEALSKFAGETIPTVDSNQTKNYKVEPVIDSPLTKFEVSTESIDTPVEFATIMDFKDAENSTKTNTVDSETTTVATNLNTLTQSVEVEITTQSEVAEVDSATVLTNSDTLSGTTSESADTEIMTMDAQNTGNDTASLFTKLEVSTELAQPIEMPTESATAVGVDNAETLTENDLETITATTLTIESSSTINAQNTESSIENTETDALSTKIEPITEPHYDEPSTETVIDIEVYSQNTEIDTITSTATVSTEIKYLTVEPLESAADFQNGADAEVLAENGLSIPDFNDITNLVATSLNEMKNLEEATSKTITDAPTATIPVDTSTVEINTESSTIQFIAKEDFIIEEVLSESTNNYFPMSTTEILTTAAGSTGIEEVSQQVTNSVEDESKTTNQPQIEPTTTDQSIDDVSSTIVNEAHSITNEVTSFQETSTEMTTQSINLNSSTDRNEEITIKNTVDNGATIFVEQVFKFETVTISTEQPSIAASDKVENYFKEFFDEPSPSDIESIFNAKLEQQESMEDDSWTEELGVDHFEAPDFVGSIAADGKTVQMVPMLRTKILQNAAEFSVKISKKEDNFYIPAFAFIREYDSIVNITWNTNEGENNSLALKVSNNEKFYVIKEVLMNVFRGNKFNMQKKAVALTPDPDMDDTIPGRTRTVVMRDGTVITFSNVEFLKKSETSEISEAATIEQKMWHFEVASASIAAIAVIAVLIYYIAVKTRAKIVLREKDELRQVTHC